MPGATVEYTLTVTVAGSGTAVGVALADAIPANTTYTAGTLDSTNATVVFAGGTIILGLPIARLRQASVKMRGFLNAISTGVLIFLLVEITGHLLEEIEELIEEAVEHGTALTGAFQYGALFVAGFSLGLLGLVYFERRFLGATKDGISPKTRAKQVAMMIAIGLGLHNLSEGLAIGQGYASGAMRLAYA